MSDMAGEAARVAVERGGSRRDTIISLDQPARLSTQWLARDIGLAQELKTGASQNGNGAIVVVHMERERCLLAWAHEEGVCEVDIDFRHEERRKKFSQIRRHFAHFHNHDFAHPEGDVVLTEQFLDACRVAHDDTRNC